ncbi:Do family serine endopeptidase [Haematospirillum sp. H1815]|nr:Do family serine endopeptidase [Haematospirillum sp. H1815]
MCRVGEDAVVRFLNLVLLCFLIGSVWSAAGANPEVPSSRQQVTLSFAPVVRRTAPAVVNIYTKKVIVTRETLPLMADPFFRRFLGDSPGFGIPRERVQNSLGSGVILRPDGVIVTNNHVIDGAAEITVVLSDRREFEAELVGADPRTDLAVLRLKDGPQSLPFLELADSGALEVGDLVIAIGNPFGVGQTVTSGIVSALARTNIGVSDYRSFIQTDAAINPGNSGGALVTTDGRLAGVNTAIYSRDGGSLGLGFAIPATMVNTTVKSILATGKAVRPWLGAGGQVADSKLVESLGLDRPGGVLVARVDPDSPADRAGLKRGDVIIAVNGHDVMDWQALRYQIASLELGSRAELSVIRKGKPVQLAFTLEPPPENPPRQETEIKGPRNPLDGIRLANANPALAEETGWDVFAGQVVVTAVRRNGYAARLGIQPGDVLQSINSKKVVAVPDAVSLLDQPAPGGWLITVLRDGNVMNFRIR